MFRTEVKFLKEKDIKETRVTFEANVTQMIP